MTTETPNEAAERLREAVREGKRIGNRRNKWHLVAKDTGVGLVTTDCGRSIERPVAFTVAGWQIDKERDSIKCRRCWGQPTNPGQPLEAAR